MLLLPAGLLAGVTLGPLPGCVAQEAPTLHGDKASFEVSNEAIAHPDRIGFNVDFGLYRPWKEVPEVNLWNTWGSAEPFDVRQKGYATSGGPDFLESLRASGGGGLSFYKSYRPGFWKGATVFIYRVADGKMHMVRQATIKQDFGDQDEGVSRVQFTEAGPPVQEGDLYLIATRKANIGPNEMRQFADRSPFSNFTFNRKGPEGGQIELDPATAAPDAGSTASLKVTFPAATSIEQPWLISHEGWVQLREGKPYVAKVWLKQQGLADNKVTLRMGGLAKQDFIVGPEWKAYELEFKGAPPTTKTGDPISFSVSGAGTVWLDNFIVVQKDAEPFAVYPETIARLKALHPSFLRLWPLQINRGIGSSLDSALGPQLSAPLQLSERAATNAAAVGLHEQLRLCAATGANPWIITSTMFTPDEWQDLIEYLAGPATTPYGKKRAAWGQPAPWTTVFPRILIEAGNETWNQMFMPQGFTGKAAAYGAFAEMMFQDMQSSPYFDAHKFHFVLNGWIANTSERGYGLTAAQSCPSADYVDFAPYLGGWDVGGKLEGDNDGLNMLMVNERMQAQALAQGATATANFSKGRAKPLGVANYESGPGYSLPGPGKPADPVEQATGKSLGTALSYLEQVLLDWQSNYGPQMFFHYGSGNYWTSHASDWRPHAATLGIQLLNQYATGDMLATKTVETPSADLPAVTLSRQVTDRQGKTTTRQRKLPALPNVPMVQLYAFRDGQNWTLVLLSLRASGDTPAQIKLPFTPAGNVTRSILTGATPMANNIEHDEVTVKTDTLPSLAQNAQLTVPPHSMIVLSGKAA